MEVAIPPLPKQVWKGEPLPNFDGNVRYFYIRGQKNSFAAEKRGLHNG